MKFDKHIVFLTPGFADGEADDACIPPMHLYIKSFAQQNPSIRISILAFQYPYRTEPYSWFGLSVYPLGGKGGNILARMVLWYKAYTKLVDLNSVQRVDLVHSFWLSECALIGNLWQRRTGIPHVCTLMGQDALSENKYLKYLNLERPHLVALCEFHATMFEKTTGLKPDEIIPWGMEATAPSLLPRTIDVLGVGNFIPLKRYAIFVKMIARLIPHFPTLKAVLIGMGPEREKLEELVKKLNVQAHIEFKGQISRTEVLQTMQQSRILLHPSEYESFGFVFTEALACGMEVVSFEVGVAKEGPKWSVVADEVSMEQLLMKRLSSPPKQENQLDYSLENTVSKYAALYQKLQF